MLPLKIVYLTILYFWDVDMFKAFINMAAMLGKICRKMMPMVKHITCKSTHSHRFYDSSVKELLVSVRELSSYKII